MGNYFPCEFFHFVDPKLSWKCRIKIQILMMVWLNQSFAAIHSQDLVTVIAKLIFSQAIVHL